MCHDSDVKTRRYFYAMTQLLEYTHIPFSTFILKPKMQKKHLHFYICCSTHSGQILETTQVP